MRSFFVLTFCLAFALTARAAEQDDNHNKKHAEKEQVQQQPVQQQAVIKPGKRRVGGNVGVQGNAGVQGNTGIQGNTGVHANTGLQVNPNLTNKQQRRLLRHQDDNLPAVQSNTQMNANAQIHADKGEKFHIKQFQTKKGPDPSIASEQFQQGKHIKGSEKWQGQQYNAFKTYKAEKHEKEWWEHHHHDHIILIGGGYYFWNAGYWCPAWGYDDAYSYYPYDGPIYAPHNLPPDQVIANVQAALQEQGYYRGEVDGFLGPLTRAALAQYQADHGLYTTAAIDEATLESLGMG
jgi:hypothetical protein